MNIAQPLREGRYSCGDFRIERKFCLTVVIHVLRKVQIIPWGLDLHQEKSLFLVPCAHAHKSTRDPGSGSGSCAHPVSMPSFSSGGPSSIGISLKPLLRGFNDSNIPF